ncbi:MATE family efflux transporter [Rhizosaccharibacter radicis]|uniref:MATE family efflux transporter n=1 Tax=Rhizosaccharibacter radicis TaxID=2782605 RepID=A0ABT1W0W1_9PROT|nr:MATE family efflux transporter [Acetobacteraceae bacterium KSS12]
MTSNVEIRSDMVSSKHNRSISGSVTTAARSTARRPDPAILDGPVLPMLLRLAAPTILVMLAQTGVNVAEAFYVGLLGTPAMAGVAMVFPVFMLMTTMSAGGLGSGVASAVARATGAGRQEDVDALVLHAVALAVLMGAVFTGAMILGGPFLYRAMGGDGTALQAALRYSLAVSAGALPLWVVNLLAGALRGHGNVRLPAKVTLVGALLLVPLSPLLIFGIGPLPGFGIAGAGIAFALYYLGAAAVLLRALLDGGGGIVLRRGRLSARLFGDILRVGIPAAYTTVATNLTVILVTAAFGHFGIAALAGYGIASRLDYVLIPLLFGLASAVLTAVGINLGAGRGGRARRIALTGAATGFAATQLIGLVVAVQPDWWLRLYTDDPAVLAAGWGYLRVIGFAYGIFGFGFVLSFAGQGAGRLLWPVCGVSSRLLIGAGFGWVAVRDLGVRMPGLVWVVAASFATYAALNAIVLLQRTTWHRPD